MKGTSRVIGKKDNKQRIPVETSVASVSRMPLVLTSKEKKENQTVSRL